MTELTAYIISGCACLLLLALGIFLVKGDGKGTWMVAGYNTMRREEREKYDTKALCRFIGWLCIAIDICIVVSVAGAYLNLGWLSVCGGVAIIAIALGSMIYANTGGRFKKKD